MAYPVHGKNAKIEYNSGLVASMHEWSLNTSRDVQEYTSFGDTWASFAESFSRATGSMTGYFNPDDTYQKAIHDTLVATSPTGAVTLQLFTDGTDYYEVSALITAVNMSASIGGMVTITMDFSVVGEPTLTTS